VTYPCTTPQINIKRGGCISANNNKIFLKSALDVIYNYVYFFSRGSWQRRHPDQISGTDEDHTDANTWCVARKSSSFGRSVSI